MVEPDIPGGRQWCEYAVPRFLPALRASIVLQLSQNYGLSQRDIARRMELSQGAVSHYVTHRRGRSRVLRVDPMLMKYAEKLAGRIAEGLKGTRLTAAICGICTAYRQGEGIEPCLCISSGVSKPEFLAKASETGQRQPCETFVVKHLLPQVRSQLAQRLTMDHSQAQAASVLGVSQPAVSQYLAGERRKVDTGPLERALSETIEQLASGLGEGVPEHQRKMGLCRICVQTRRLQQPPVEIPRGVGG